MPFVVFVDFGFGSILEAIGTDLLDPKPTPEMRFGEKRALPIELFTSVVQPAPPEISMAHNNLRCSRKRSSLDARTLGISQLISDIEPE